MKQTRRNWLRAAGALGGLTTSACRKDAAASAPRAPAGLAGEEYVWLAPHCDLPIFVAHDHPAMRLAARELGVKATIAGPSMVDIPALVATIEQIAAQRPAGLLVVGWDPSALVEPINLAVQAGVPVICVDADVPASKRLSFVGTDWRVIGREQGRAMVAALGGRKGQVGMLGMIEQTIDLEAFAGFRDIVTAAGLTLLEPQQDHGNSADAARVASGLIQACPDLVGLAGFDSESGPGIGMAARESGRAGRLVCTCVDAEEPQLRLIREGVLTAAVAQKRELFTYFGLKLLYALRHGPLHFGRAGARTGVPPIPEIVYTGTYTVNRLNVDQFLS